MRGKYNSKEINPGNTDDRRTMVSVKEKSNSGFQIYSVQDEQK